MPPSSTTRARRLRRPVTIALAAGAAAAATLLDHAGAVAPLGPELPVNVYTTSAQARPAVAVTPEGDFVVTWASDGQDGDLYGVVARRFAASGAPLGGELQVNQHTAWEQTSPAIAIEAGGGFVVVWQSYDQDGDGYAVVARRYDAAGSPAGDELQVNTHTTSYQRAPVAATAVDGGYVLAWASDQDGSAAGVFARRFTGSLTPHDVEFQVNVHTLNYQGNPEIASAGDGRFVVAWESYQDGSSYGVFARRFDPAGEPEGGEIPVNAHTTDLQAGSVVGVAPDGSFVVAWESYLQDGSSYGVFARRFTAAGAPVGGEIAVNEHTTGAQIDPTLAIDASGLFVVAWRSPQDGSDYGIFARAFRADGTPASGELQVNTHTSGYQGDPAAAMTAGGDFVVTWASGGQDGSDYGVFARRFAARVLDVDGDAEVEAMRDGLLVLRRLFGFSGPALVGGAVDLASCSRCTADPVAERLAAIEPWLDADGDGEVVALTDGLLIMRYLLGTTGDALVGQAVRQPGCTRCTAAEIESYLATLL